VAFTAASCSDHDELQNSQPDANAIIFGTTVQVETKAPVSGTNIPDGDKVGIYALTHATTPAWAASDNLMDNIEATVNGAGGLEYSPLKEYTKNNLHNFYAYYPYTTTASDGDGVVAPTAGGAPTLTVTLAKTPDAQLDYMYATPIENYKRTEAEAGVTQKLVFNHALTQVRFKFKNTETSNKVSIVSIQVKDKDKGTMSITDGTWSSLSATASGNTFTFYSPASIQEVAGGASMDIPGQLMLFPKTGAEMAANTKDSGLDFVLNLKDNSDQDKSVTITPKVPATGLEAGKSYLYTLLYSETAKDFITLSTEVVDWVNAVGGDLPVTPLNE
ncbi:MAG: fimbrillin family protein, partial [Parabacteroides sp.]|nr:fimbrillin family protein [Parabacteroides sp.]